MANDIMEASITVEWIDTDEEPFVPTGTTGIFATLTPIERDDATFYTPEYLDFWEKLSMPYIPKYGEIPEFEDVQKELIINIETSRVKPWEGKTICIGVLDPNALKPEALNFMQETEEETLNEFIAWFNTTRFTILIGYNVSFDYRWIYVLLQKYRKELPRWKEMKLEDMMQQQKQVKAEFVYGNNPTGKLEDWADYLFGMKPYAKQKQVLKWLAEGNVEEIVNFNTDKLTKTYFLWALDKIVDGAIPGSGSSGNPESPEAGNLEHAATPGIFNPEIMVKVPCPECKQNNEMLKTDKVVLCKVCSTPIKNPAL